MTTVTFVGCAHIHTPGFIQHVNSRPEIQCKSILDHNTAWAAKRAVEMDAQVVSDAATIYYDPEIEAVIVCTETNLHELVVLPAAAAKKHLFIEKPLGFGAADAVKMADAISGRKDVALVGVREAAYRSAVMEALYEGARMGTWVKPK